MEGLGEGRRFWGGAEVLGEGRRVLEAGRRVWGRSRGPRRRGQHSGGLAEGREGRPRAGSSAPSLDRGLGAEEPDQPLTRWDCGPDIVRELLGPASWECGDPWA